jgi:hypothetical protein
MRTILIPLLVLFAGPAGAAELTKSQVDIQGACELVCDTKNADNSWTSTSSCYQQMNNRQCSALADHRNLSDAYPNRMRCKAALSSSCTETRQ